MKRHVVVTSAQCGVNLTTFTALLNAAP